MKTQLLGTQPFAQAILALSLQAQKKGWDVCAVTGHRPHKLLGKDDRQKTEVLADFIFERVLPGHAVSKPVKVAHIGGADGVDTAFGLALARAKREGQDVKYALFIPTKGHPDWFTGQQKAWYDEVAEHADIVGFCLDRVTERGDDTTKALHSRNNCMLVGPEGLSGAVQVPAQMQDFNDPIWSAGNVRRVIAMHRPGSRGGTQQCMTRARERDIRIDLPWEAYKLYAAQRGVK